MPGLFHRHAAFSFFSQPQSSFHVFCPVLTRSAWERKSALVPDPVPTTQSPPCRPAAEFMPSPCSCILSCSSCLVRIPTWGKAVSALQCHLLHAFKPETQLICSSFSSLSGSTIYCRSFYPKLLEAEGSRRDETKQVQQPSSSSLPMSSASLPQQKRLNHAETEIEAYQNKETVKGSLPPPKVP